MKRINPTLRKNVRLAVLALMVIAGSSLILHFWFYNRTVIRRIDSSEVELQEGTSYIANITVTFRNDGNVAGSSLFVFHTVWPSGGDEAVKEVFLEPHQTVTVSVVLKCASEGSYWFLSKEK